MNKKIYFYLAICIVIVIVVLIIFLRPKEEANLPVSETDIVSIANNQATKPQVIGDKVIFLKDETTLTVADSNLKTSKDVFKAESKIVDFYPSSDLGQAIIALQSEDQVDNYLANLESGKATKIEPCLAEAIAWLDDNRLVANCYEQKFDYDPNTVNSIVFTDEKGANQQKITDLKIDPPKAIYPFANNFLLLTRSPGYASNDVLVLDTASKSVTNITKNGFVQDIKKAGKYYLALTKKDNEPGEILLIDQGQNVKKLLNAETLDQYSVSNDRLVSIDQNGDLAISALNNPSKPSQLISISQAGKVKQIITSDNQFYLFSDSGIYKIILPGI